MKTISMDMRDHLDEDVTTLATCWQIIRRDGTTFRFTEHDRDLIVDGENYLSFAGYARTSISTDEKLSVDNLDVQGFLDALGITEDDVRAGLYNRAEIRMFLVNWANTAMGDIRLRRGWIGDMITTRTGLFKSELRGLASVFQQPVLELFGPECRADLGDSRCRVPIDPPVRQNSVQYALGTFIKVVTAGSPDGTYADYENRIYECTTAGETAASQPTYDETPGNTTTDRTAVFTARQAWTRHATIATVTNRLTFTITVDEARAVDDWFNYGSVIFETGDNAGAVCEIKDWVDSTNTITLFVPAYYVPEVGDKIRLYKGCDFTRTSCLTFDNILNFRGEPFMTGDDYVFRAADPPLA